MHWRRLTLAAGFVVAYLYAFPYFSRLHSANEAPRIYLTEEIVEHHTFRLDARWDDLSRGSTFDVATTPDGHHYSNKAPGASLVALPAYLALRVFGVPSFEAATWAFRVTEATLPALLFLPFFFGLARRFAGRDEAARAALLALGLGSMLFVYGQLFYSHALAAACAGGAFAAAVTLVREEPARRRWRAFLVGLLAGGSILADYQSVFAALGVGAYLLACSPRRWRLRDAGWALAGAIPPGLMLAVYQKVCFGSPLRTGYAFAADSANQMGVMGIIGPNAAAMRNALIAPDNGLIVLMPWALLALVGVVVVLRSADVRRRIGAEVLVAGLIVLAYLLFLGSLVPEFGRAGWSVGPRYITVALPFLAWLAATGLAAVDDRPVWRALAHGLVLAGVAIFVLAATTYPHWPTSFSNPLYEVSLRLLGDGHAPRSLGTLLGLRGLPSLIPLYLLVAGLCVALLGPWKSRWKTTLAAAVIAAAIVVAYGAFPKGAPPDKYQFIVSEWEP